jgi:translation elongation factor EF-Tu-like GTPase
MAIVLTNTYFVDDAELLALVHMELIEYMNQLDLPTDKIPTFLDYEKSQYDSNDPTMPIRKGISQIVGFVKRQK